MHTHKLLSPTDIEITMRGNPAALADAFPGLDANSRFAIVTTQDGGGFGAATLLLAAVAWWYEQRSPWHGDFWEYPDFYVVQVGRERGDFAQLDIWPPYKQPVIKPDAELVIAALCDRAINYVLVEEGSPRAATILRETRNAIPRHLRAAVAYSPSGRVADATMAVRGNHASERLIDESLARSTNLPASVREVCRLRREAIVKGHRQIETFRTLDLDSALGLLVPSPSLGVSNVGPLGLSARVRESHRLTSVRLAPITVTIGRSNATRGCPEHQDGGRGLT